jgi:hypothetical protein
MKCIARALLVLAVLVPSALFAQSPTTNMLGPNSPARIDTNGDGTITPADGSVIPTRVGATIQIQSPWHAGINGDNTINVSNPDGSGRMQTFTRNTTDGMVDVLNVTGISPGGTPTAFAMQHTGGSSPSGTGQLLDQNSDGIYDGVSAAGAVSFNINFVDIDTSGDGWADFVSIPWGQAQLVGVDFSNPIGPVNPQVWVPLADTNGDGLGDAIVPDLDANNAPDPDLYRSAGGTFGPVAAAAVVGSVVPTLSQWAMLLTLMLLSVIALLQFRRMEKPTIRF